MENEDIIRRLSAEHDSFYIYDGSTIQRNIRDLKGLFPSVRFLYRMMCNPNEHIVGMMKGNGLGCEASSAGEVWKAVFAGFPADSIYYYSPGRSERDISDTIGMCSIIADSASELDMIDSVAFDKDIRVKVGVRLALDHDLRPSRFGITEDSLYPLLNGFSNAEIDGICIDVNYRDLSPLAAREFIVNALATAGRICERYDMSYIHLGSHVDAVLNGGLTDISPVTERSSKVIASFRKAHPGIRLLMSSGRYLLSDAGTYVTKVMDRKSVAGTEYVILDNAMSGPVWALLSEMPIREGYTSDRIKVPGPHEGMETVTLVGSTPINGDLLASHVVLPVLRKGDVVTLSDAAAFSRTMYPMQFASRQVPLEFFIDTDGDVADTYTRKVSDVLSTDLWMRGMTALQKELGEEGARRFMDMMSLSMHDYSLWRKDRH